jgi:multidrug efflux system outer membrane protein
MSRVASIATSALLLGLAACKVPPRQEVTLHDHVPVPVVQQDAANQAAPWPTEQWWIRYDDPVLSQLIQTATVGAPRIELATARIDAAREQVRVAGASKGLSVDLKGSWQRLRLSDNGLLPPEFLGFNWYNQADLGVDVRYTLDWWGKQRAGIDAALDRARAALVEQRATMLALSAAVAQEYFGWQADSARLVLAEQRLQLLQSQQQLAARRVSARLETADTGQQLEQQLAAAEEVTLLLRTSQRLRVIALAALVGVAETDLPQLQARALPRPPTGLPEQLSIGLMAHRPDIVASRWRVTAAQRDTDAIRASYYPDITVHALGALQSIELGELLYPASLAPNMGIAFNLPIFDGGLRDARHGAATAALAEAIATYNGAVMDAARDVGSAARRLESAQAQRTLRERQEQAAEALLHSASARVARGLTHRGPEVDARLLLLSTQDSLQQNAYDTVIADIQLNQALGGGFTDEGTTP